MPYHEIYNELPSVGDSFDSVQATGKFEAFRLEIKQLLEKKKLLDIVCIRLSHSHWKVAPGEILYEQDSQYKGQKASLTMPMASDSLPEHVPTWWMYANGTYQGAEFTSDPLVIAAVRKLEEDKEVFGEFMEVAKKFGYEKLLVPGIKTPSPSDAEAVTVEYNDVEGESYVIEEKEAEKHHDTDQFTPTVWDPETGKANVHCFNVLRCKVKKTDDLVTVEYNDVEGKSYVIEEKETEKHHDTNQFTPTVWDPATGKASVHCFDVMRCKVKKTDNVVAVEYNDVEGKSYVIEEKEAEKHHDTNQFTPTVWDPVTGKANVHCFDVLRCKAKKTNNLVAVEYNDIEGKSYVIEEKEAEKHHDTNQFTPTVWDPVTGKANVHCFDVMRCKVKKTNNLVAVEYNDVEGKSYVIEEKETEKHHDTNQFTPTVWDPVTGKANVHCFDVLRCKVKKTNNLVTDKK